jgi:hypothetical protein
MAGAVIVVAGTAAFAALLTELLLLAADRRTHPGDDLLIFICGTPAARGAAWSRPSFRMPPGPGGWLTIYRLSAKLLRVALDESSRTR